MYKYSTNTAWHVFVRIPAKMNTEVAIPDNIHFREQSADSGIIEKLLEWNGQLRIIGLYTLSPNPVPLPAIIHRHAGVGPRDAA